VKYDTTDASTHFAAAINTVEEDGVLINTNVNYPINIDFEHLLIGAYINSGIFFEIFRGNLEDMDIYKLYIFFDMFMLFISGIVMYAMVSEINKKQVIRYIGFIIAIIYTLGYPLNSVIMGCAYLTLSLIFATAIILIWNKKETISGISFSILLFIFNLGLVHSYILFGIVVLLSEIILYLIQDKKKAIKTILICIILPLATWIIYTNNAQDEVNLIKEEGPMYKNYYSNFIIYIPFIIYLIYMKIKDKEKIDFSTVLFGIMFVLLPIAYILKNEKIISSYYYSKFYYLLWIPTLFLFVKSLYAIYRQRKLAMYIVSRSNSNSICNFIYF
jgi:hypothetical protein